MKIVMLCDFFHESQEYQENLLTRYYIKHGHQVTVIASTCDSIFEFVSGKVNRTAPARTYEHGGARIVRLPYRLNVLNRLRMFPNIEPILERERPDLIFVHDIMLNVLDAVRWVQRRPGCRMIMDFHADYSNSGKNWLSLAILHGTIRKWFLDRARPHLRKIFPIVPASETFLREVYGVSASEMELLPLGADVDLARDVAGRGERERLRQALGIGASDIVVFSGGKLTPAKRTELLIEAVAGMARPDLHLVVVGESTGADASYRARLVESASGNPRIHFTGWLDSQAIYSHLAMADFAVFPASQSVVWQQAICSGLPLVVGDVGHQDASYMNLYDNIRILRGDDINVKEIARAVTQLSDDPQLRERMAQGARRVAAELLDWNRLIAKTLQFNER